MIYATIILRNIYGFSWWQIIAGATKITKVHGLYSVEQNDKYHLGVSENKDVIVSHSNNQPPEYVDKHFVDSWNPWRGRGKWKHPGEEQWGGFHFLKYTPTSLCWFTSLLDT